MKALFALIGAGSFVAVVACGANPPPEAKAPGAVSTGTAAQPSGPAKAALASPPSSPTASAVRIDDAILKTCGIQAPTAFFAFDSAHLEQYDTKVLEQVATCFTTGPLKGRGLRLVGHADPRGETEYNFVLGNSRADAVAGFLGTKGMDKAKVDTTSRGELDATGTDESGWAKDRRVDVLLGR
jgi:peptidoglycan-associated lipoprotein